MDSLICPLLGTKDEYSFISSTEEQNESKRLNVLEKGGMGSRMNQVSLMCCLAVFSFCFVVT